MAEVTGSRKITELVEKTTPSDTDIIAAGDGGTAALRKISLSNLAAWIKTKVSNFTFTFNTGTKSIIAAINDLAQAAGEMNYVCNCAGYVTASSTRVGATIPPNRVNRNLSIQSMTVNGCQLRQDGNYLYNNTSDPTDLNVSVSVNNCGLGLIISKSDGTAFPNAVNNGVVAVYISLTVVWG